MLHNPENAGKAELVYLIDCCVVYFYFYETKQSFINPRTDQGPLLLLTLAQFTPPVRGTTTLLGNGIIKVHRQK